MSHVVDLNTALPEVMDDFRAVLSKGNAAAVLHLVHLDRASDPEVTRLVPDAEAWLSPAEPDDTRFLLIINDNITALLGSMTSRSRLAVEICSALQDHVMDMINSPWPIVAMEDGRLGVAEPQATEDRAHWTVNGNSVALVGSLSNALA